MNTEKRNTYQLNSNNMKNKIIYFSNNHENLKRIKLDSKNRIYELLLERLDVFKYKEGISYLVELGICKDKIFEVRKEIFEQFISNIEEYTNEYLATNMFEKIINVLTYEFKNELNTVQESSFKTSYLLDTRTNHNIKKYKKLRSFLKNEYIYKEKNEVNDDLTEDIEDLYSFYESGFVDFIHNVFLKISFKVICNNIKEKNIPKINEDYFYSKNSSFFNILSIIGKIYFSEITRLDIKEIFFIYKNEKHIRMYSDCLKNAENIEYEENYDKALRSNIDRLIFEIQKEPILTRIKVVTLSKHFDFTFGNLSSINNDRIQENQIKRLLYSAIKENLAVTIVKRDYTYLKIANKKVQKTSAFSIINGNVFSQDKNIVKRVDKKNMEKYNNELIVIYEDFKKEYIDILKNKISQKNK